MSTLNVNTINAATTGQAVAVDVKNPRSFRNLIINGAMQCSQRGSVSAVASAYGACDRWKLFSSGTSARFDTTQSTDVPSGSGFSNSLKLDCSTADTSLGSADYYMLMQQIEGLNLQHLKYGTSSAEKCTLSFWVKSPKTGVHNLEIESADGGKFNTTQYSISSANTWQKVEITFDGYQTTAIANDNTVGLYITFWLQAGSAFTGGSYSANTWHSTNGNRAVNQVNVLDSTSNDFYITGVQLEVGDVPTDFEHRSYGDELARCQRYYYAVKGDTNDQPGISGSAWGSNFVVFTIRHPVEMRANPSFSGTGNCRFQSQNDSAAIAITDMGTSNPPTQFGGLAFSRYGTSGATASAGGNFQFQTDGAELTFSAEL